jgi:lysyl-tRNA synthetase class 2
MILVSAPARQAADFSDDILRWRRPAGTGHSRFHYLRQRDRIETLVREWFHREGFLHVASPVLVPCPNPEAHITITRADGGCLITSPELQLKRMLTGGFERIFSLVPCFRGKETDDDHNPEFTMLEWYRVGGTLDDMARDLERLLIFVQEHLADRCPFPAPPWPRQSCAALVAEKRGSRSGERPRVRALRAGACRRTLYAGSGAGLFRPLFSRLWSRFEAELGRDTPLFITGWPLPLASLAAVDPEDATQALRMELVAGGLELANGFRELTDPEEQRRRMEAELAARQAASLPMFSLDEQFLRSVAAGLPESAGMALGFDRLCMLLTGAPSIRAVLPFAADEL